MSPSKYCCLLVIFAVSYSPSETQADPASITLRSTNYDIQVPYGERDAHGFPIKYASQDVLLKQVPESLAGYVTDLSATLYAATNAELYNTNPDAYGFGSSSVSIAPGGLSLGESTPTDPRLYGRFEVYGGDNRIDLSGNDSLDFTARQLRNRWDYFGSGNFNINVKTLWSN